MSRALAQVFRHRSVTEFLRGVSFRNVARNLSTSNYCPEKWVIESKYKPIDIPNVSFSQYLFDAQEKFASKTSLINGETSESFTNAEIRTLSMNVASALVKLGVEKGDVIGLVAPNCPEFLISFLAVAATGAVNTTVNCTYTAEEIARQLQNAKATRVIVHPFFLSVIQKTQEVYPALKEVILISGPAQPGTLSLGDLCNDDGTAFPHNMQINPAEDLVVLPYSSGTTGLPKGVMLTHQNLVANLEQVMAVGNFLSATTDQLSDDFQETFIGVLPMFHIYGMVPCLSLTVTWGAKMVTMMKFDPEMFVKNIVKYQATCLHTVPPIVQFLTTNPQVPPKALKSVHAILSGAAPSGASLIDQCLAKFNHGMSYIEGYGLTESSPVTHLSQPNVSAIGAVGFSLPNTRTKIVHLETGETLGPHEEGELCVYGPQIMKGYYDNEEATKNTLSSDGWLHTGDIAKMDDEENVFIVDRLKELIKVKGLQVAPAELEDLLRSHPAVNDVAVIGIPDLRAGEVPRAYVVKSSDVSEEDLSSFVEKEVAPHKKLAGGVVFIDQIPKSATGKILRRELKELATS